jgi:diguanylate cyclase (GGDEF)-like protein
MKREDVKAPRPIRNRRVRDDAQMIADIGLLADRLVRHCPPPKTLGGKPLGTKARQIVPLFEQAIAAAAEVEERIAEQKARIAYLETLSQTDELTGLLNRRGFHEHLRRALANARRYGDSGVLVFCDLDNFKAVNDNHGHGVGDDVLRRVAETIKDSVRETDAVARLGGDEFAVLMSQTSWRNGYKRAQIINRAINGHSFTVRRKRIETQISFGVEPFGPDDEEANLMARADMAMYCNKRKKASVSYVNAAE